MEQKQQDSWWRLSKYLTESTEECMLSGKYFSKWFQKQIQKDNRKHGLDTKITDPKERGWGD